MGRASICSLLDLVGASLREGDGEQTEKIVIGRLHSDVGFNQRLPLAHKGSQLVGREIQTVEVGQAVLSLDFVHAELDLTEGMVLVILQVGKGDFEDTALQGIVRVLQTTGTVHQSLSNTSTRTGQ